MIYLTYQSEKEILEHAKTIDEIIANSPFTDERKQSLETAQRALIEIAQTRCNGWSNYPTWLLAATIDNNRNLYEFFRNLAKQVNENYTNEMIKTNMIVQSLQEYLASRKPKTGGLYSSLIDHVIDMINVPEVAKAILDDN